MNLKSDHSPERIERLVKSEVWWNWFIENWKPEIGDWYCYLDPMCGRPCYCINTNNIKSPPQDASLYEKYEYNSFQEIWHNTKLKDKADGLTGIILFIPQVHQQIAILSELGYSLVIDGGYFSNSMIVKLFKSVHEERRKLVKTFTAVSTEQAFDEAIVWASKQEVNNATQ